uniref:Xpo1 domain-containing protein n=1 Tax=Syphacia muris TaxID=451379 RepID=A0A0N5A8I2_9BILA
MVMESGLDLAVGAAPPEANGVMAGAGSTSFGVLPKVRRKFPEVWIWANQNISAYVAHRLLCIDKLLNSDVYLATILLNIVGIMFTRPEISTSAAPIFYSTAAQAEVDEVVPAVAAFIEGPVVKVRKEFPELWFWISTVVKNFVSAEHIEHDVPLLWSWHSALHCTGTEKA